MTRKIILLVEAEQPEGLSARKIIVESLRHHVFIAHSGAEALDLLERIHADFVLVHSNIEGQSCDEIIREIHQRFPQLQVVALIPGATILSGPVITIDSMRPQDLVSFFECKPGTLPI